MCEKVVIEVVKFPHFVVLYLRHFVVLHSFDHAIFNRLTVLLKKFFLFSLQVQNLRYSKSPFTKILLATKTKNLMDVDKISNLPMRISLRRPCPLS